MHKPLISVGYLQVASQVSNALTGLGSLVLFAGMCIQTAVVIHAGVSQVVGGVIQCHSPEHLHLMI